MAYRRIRMDAVQFSRGLPLGPEALHYITFLFRIDFPKYVNFYVSELVSNYFLDYEISCVVAKHTMWIPVGLHNCSQVNLPVM